MSQNSFSSCILYYDYYHFVLCSFDLYFAFSHNVYMNISVVWLQAQFNLFVSINTVAPLIDGRYSSEHDFVCLKQCVCSYYILHTARRIHQLNWNGIKFIMKCINMSHVNNIQKIERHIDWMYENKTFVTFWCNSTEANTLESISFWSLNFSRAVENLILVSFFCRRSVWIMMFSTDIYFYG